MHVVARAVGIPVRRLEGWVEQGLVAPVVPASGTGTRALFSTRDVLRIAIIADIQRLFGNNFRPGSVAAAIGRDPLFQAHLDTALRLALQDEDPSTQGRTADSKADSPLRLFVHLGSDNRMQIGATRKSPAEILKVKPVVLFINPVEMSRKIQPRLDG